MNILFTVKNKNTHTHTHNRTVYGDGERAVRRLRAQGPGNTRRVGDLRCSHREHVAALHRRGDCDQQALVRRDGDVPVRNRRVGSLWIEVQAGRALQRYAGQLGKTLSILDGMH